MFIGEASKISGTTQRAIRLYESLGLLKIARHGKYRIYSKKNIEHITLIKEAQSLGIKLSEIITLMNEQDEFDWKLVSEFLKEKYNMINNEIRELEIKKINIKKYQNSIGVCLKELDSNP